jgi:hypothetical protein
MILNISTKILNTVFFPIKSDVRAKLAISIVVPPMPNKSDTT